MGTIQLEDLLRDDLAGQGGVSAWECTLQMLFIKPDPSAIARLKWNALKHQLPLALQNLTEWLRQASSIGAIHRLDPDGEIPLLLEGLKSVEFVARTDDVDSQSSRNQFLALQELIDNEVFAFMGMQDRLYRQFWSQFDGLDPEARSSAKESLASLEKGLGEVGLARSDKLRKSKSGSVTISDSNSGAFCTAAALLAAFSTWKISRSVEDSRRILRRAWGRAQRDGDSISVPISRFLGNLEWIDGNHDLAVSALNYSAEHSAESEAVLEATLLAIETRRWDDAKSLLKAGVKSNPLFILRALACPEMIEVAGDLFEILVAKQKEARKQAVEEVANWRKSINQVKTAESRSESSFHFIASFEHQRKTLSTQISKADIFTAQSLAFEARSMQQEIVRMAVQQLSYEYAEVRHVINAALAGVDQATAEREAMIEQAVAQQTEEVQIARQALHLSLKDAEKGQVGCMVSLGSGCGGFLLYLVIAFFLTAQGINAGFGTIIGWFGLAASGIPILFAIGAQITYGAQRAALDKVLHDKIRLAQVAYEIAAKQADRYYREKVLILREGIEDKQALSTRLEESLKLLQA